MKKGYSLYELLIVMGIMVIITAIAIPATSYFLPSLKLSSSGREINVKLRQAQEEAVTTQIRHALRLNPTANPVTLQIVKIETSETVLETINLSNGIIVSLDSSITNNQIIFSSDGGPNVSGNITINLGEASKVVNISPAGVIRLQ